MRARDVIVSGPVGRHPHDRQEATSLEDPVVFSRDDVIISRPATHEAARQPQCLKMVHRVLSRADVIYSRPTGVLSAM